MRWFVFVIVLLAAMILQGGNLLNFTALTDYNIRPNVLIILFIYLAVNIEPPFAIAAAFFVGFGADTVALPMGPNMISFVLLATALSGSRILLRTKSLVLQGVLIFITAIVSIIFSSLLAYIFKGSTIGHFTYKLFTASLYSALVGPFIWLALDWITRLTGIKQER